MVQDAMEYATSLATYDLRGHTRLGDSLYRVYGTNCSRIDVVFCNDVRFRCLPVE